MKAIRDIIISEVEPPVNNVGWLKPLSNGNFMLFFFTRKGWIPVSGVDTSMSDTSMNPVQNKVIKAYIDGLVGNVAAQLAQI